MGLIMAAQVEVTFYVTFLLSSVCGEFRVIVNATVRLVLALACAILPALLGRLG